MGLERIKGYQRLEQTKKAYRRDGYNRGVRATMKYVNTYMQDHYRQYPEAQSMIETAELIYGGLQKLLKPSLENPNITVKR